ncbi:hypothetical protein HDA32_001713 [Spinactinospora alkalitolerans]|uniref:Uncharacterized protein n=1 Tax=Spinactinospora alkalitolerans TaxID=687207 RepID=A0A852TUX2_9ACTN|nr:hypothetical protein [Spinactinospora alkalitolerans]NYE46593.1 hypothetical protein [Spinactinospora alkalitolerans]
MSGEAPRPRPVPAPPGGAPGEAALAEQTAESVRRRLDGLDGLPTAEHVAVFDALQRELSAVLGRLDQDQDGGRERRE